jgi:tight adherence protein B
MQYLYLSLAFFAGFLLIFGVNWMMVDVFEASRRGVRIRLQEETRARHLERISNSPDYTKMLKSSAMDIDPPRCDPTIRERMRIFVEESGVAIGPKQLLFVCLGAGVSAALLVPLAGGPAILGLPAGMVVALLPVLYVGIRRAKRREKLLSQLPDAFDLMSRTLRAGQTTSQALQAVADEFSSPIAEEFGYCHDQQNLGLSPEAALRDLSKRTGLLELKIFVLAVIIHRQTGGNFANLLEKLASVIRERHRIRGAIKALTAEGRLQAIILLALPPGMLVMLSVTNRPYMMTLFEYPLLLVAMFVSMTIGGLWMRRIINFDF